MKIVTTQRLVKDTEKTLEIRRQSEKKIKLRYDSKVYV